MRNKILILGVACLQVIAANATVIQQTPISLSPKPNIILAYDDSGSMSRTTIPDAGDESPAFTTQSKMSSYYNPLYYNPNMVYLPWVKTKTSTGLVRYPNAPMSSLVSLAPDGVNIAKDGTLVSDSTYQITYTCGKTSYKNTINFETGAAFTDRAYCSDKSGDNYTMTSNYTVKTGQVWQKVVSTSTASYFNLVPAGTCTVNTTTCFTAPVCGGTSTCPVTATGALLQKVVISTSDTTALQNYANWKQYAETRQKMVSFAMSKVLTTLVGVNVGFEPFNATSTTNSVVRGIDSSISSVTYADTSYYAKSGRMYNMDLPSDVTTLLDLVYNTFSNSATPTRTTLNRIGGIFSNKTLNYSSYANDGTAVTGKGVMQFSCQKNAAFVLTDGYSNQTAPSLSLSYASTYSAAAPYTPIVKNSLTDIATAYYTNNIRGDFTVGQVPKDTYSTVNADTNQNPHMNTYAVTLGAMGEIYGKSSFSAQNTAPFTNKPAWGDPNVAYGNEGSTNNPRQIDDLWHSTINGRGMMFQAADPNALVSQIENGILHVILSAGTRASIAVANKYMDASNNAVYIPSYYLDANGNYLGDVKKYTVTLATQTLDVANADWSASAKLSAVTTPATTRKIVTYNGSTGASFNNTTSGLAASLVSYIRGDKSLEGTTYRKRTALFGDVINASPAVVQNGPTTTVYQAANDGMLHAIDAATGDELWAYVPKAVGGQFANYSTTGGSHQYIVDGTPTYGKAGTKTILVGGLGYNTAASAFYALDITSPVASSEADAASKVMWEFPFTTAQRQNLGTSTAQPVIASTHAFGAVAIVSSGYNNGTGTIGGVAQTGGDGKGHVWFIKTITDTVSPAGTVLAEMITTGGSTSAPIGMASLGGFISNSRVDSSISALYGGDELGNIWKFDVSNANSSSWASSKVASGLQAITTAPNLGADPIDGKAIVYVGTGELLNANDISNIATQSFYAVKDSGSTVTKTDLLKLDMNTTTRNITLPCSITDAEVAKFNKGWYFDFPIGGERVVGDIQFNSGIVLFKTNVISSNTCSDKAYNWNLTPPQTLVKRTSCTDTNNGEPIVEPVLCVTGSCADETLASTSSTIIFYKGNIKVVSSDGTIKTIGAYLQGRQMGAWREIVRN
jgi:type IV pilus assembly protein PilY1